MRLRFRRLSFPVLIVFAAIIGGIFYYFDNPQSDAPSGDDPASIINDTVGANPTTVASQDIAQNSSGLATRFTENSRPELPEDTKIWIHEANVWSDVIQAYFSEGNWDIRNLRSKAGHLEGTNWVTQGGNTVISGHVELANGLPGVFANLDNMSIGDEIRVISDGIEYVYVVSETYYTVPTDLSPLRPTTEDRLTLITCDSYDIVTNVYRERLIIVAERVS